MLALHAYFCVGRSPRRRSRGASDTSQQRSRGSWVFHSHGFQMAMVGAWSSDVDSCTYSQAPHDGSGV